MSSCPHVGHLGWGENVGVGTRVSNRGGKVMTFIEDRAGGRAGRTAPLHIIKAAFAAISHQCLIRDVCFWWPMESICC